MLIKYSSSRYPNVRLNLTSRSKCFGVQPSVKSFSTLLKITLNRGLGAFSDNKRVQQSSIDEFCLITGQYPKLIYSKNAIAGFKLRENLLIGLKVTLRSSRMYSFLDRLIHLAFPQIPDFKGCSSKNFDGSGNYNFGLSDQSIFPEVSYDKISEQLGFNITFVFSSLDPVQNLAFLKTLNFPFF